jgi:hypothetical protein
VCGNACCSDGDVCLDSGASKCGAPAQPTFTLTDADSGTFRGRSGGPTADVLGGTTLKVTGVSFAPGTVTIAIEGALSGSPVIATADATGRFTATILVAALRGTHTLTATETVNGGTLQASEVLNVQVVH